MRLKRRTVIYALCAIDTGEVVYVGATANAIERLTHHRSGCDQSSGAWIRHMAEQRREWGFLILDIVENDDADAAETKWIRFYEERGAVLNKKGLKGNPHHEAYVATLRRATKQAGTSIRRIARALGISSQVLIKAHKGLLPISERDAFIVQAMTKSEATPAGFEASLANWPKLRAA